MVSGRIWAPSLHGGNEGWTWPRFEEEETRYSRPSLTRTPAPPPAGYLDVPVRQQQVDDDVHRQALHVVQPLLDAAQLGGQLGARVQLPGLPDLVQNHLPEVLAVNGGQEESHAFIEW